MLEDQPNIQPLLSAYDESHSHNKLKNAIAVLVNLEGMLFIISFVGLIGGDIIKVIGVVFVFMWMLSWMIHVKKKVFSQKVIMIQVFQFNLQIICFFISELTDDYHWVLCGCVSLSSRTCM